MTQIKSKIPKIRFKEFSGEWEEKKLGEVSEGITYGIGASAVKYDGVNKYIRITDIDETSRKFKPNPLTSPDLKVENKYILKKGDIVFARTGASVGKSYLYNEKDGNLIFAGFLIKASINKADSSFVFNQTLKSGYDKWVRIMSMRSGQPGINAEEYKSFSFYSPQLPEQQKIAGFLSLLDEKIENIKEKKKSLEEYKKGVMQKIFSREIRFKDENGGDFGEWEEKKIENVFNMKAGNSKSKYINKDGNNIIVDMGAIGSNYKLIGNKKTNYSDDYLTKNDLVMAKDDIGGGNIIGKVVSIEENNKYVLGDHVYKLTLVSGVIKYLYYTINSYKINKSFRQKANGTAQIGITNGTVLNQLIPFPPLPEQQKIADFLSGVDEKIESVGGELERVEEFKKGLLQGMFV